jgi:hypothetical protein
MIKAEIDGRNIEVDCHEHDTNRLIKCENCGDSLRGVPCEPDDQWVRRVADWITEHVRTAHPTSA